MAEKKPKAKRPAAAASVVEVEKPVKMGRPSKADDPKTIEQAAKLYRKGFTDEELAEFFEVTRVTIHNWKQAHPDFFNTQKLGKDEADEKVVHSLYKRALGYKITAEKVVVADGMAQVVPYEHNVAPDVTACIFWLKNRRPKEWRDKQEIEQTNTQPTLVQFVDAPKQESMKEWIERRGKK